MIKQEKRKLLVILPLLFLCMFSAIAQTPAVNVQSILAPVNTLSLSDLNFIEASTPRWLFTVNLTPLVAVPLDVRMNLRLAVSLAGDGVYDSAAIYRSRVFTLTGMRSLTNLDLRDPALLEEFHIESSARQRIEATALPGSSVPSGTYEFIVEITTPDGGTVLGGDEERMILTNPGVVELLLPSDGETMSTQYPLFQWRGDAPTWRFSVYQRLPGQSSLEETASGVPHATATVNAPTFQYPTGGVRVLETGESYVWFVEGLIQGTGGITTAFKSPLRVFTVASGGVAGPTPSMLDELERVLGPQYKPLFDQIRSEGLSATGAMKLNGSPISTTELIGILNALRTTPDAVTSAVVE